MPRLALAATLALAACTAQSHDAEPIDGTWALVDDADGCTSTLTFDAGTYTQQMACPLPDGSIGAEVWQGIYTVDGDGVWLEVTAGTCGNATWPLKLDREQTFTWAMDDGDLVLGGSMRLEAHEPVDVDVTGCWSTTGEFARGEMEAVK